MTRGDRDAAVLGELAAAGYAVQFGAEAVFGMSSRWVSRAEARRVVAASGWPGVRRPVHPDGVSAQAWRLVQRVVLAWADLPEDPAVLPPGHEADALVRLLVALTEALPDLPAASRGAVPGRTCAWWTPGECTGGPAPGRAGGPAGAWPGPGLDDDPLDRARRSVPAPRGAPARPAGRAGGAAPRPAGPGSGPAGLAARGASSGRGHRPGAAEAGRGPAPEWREPVGDDEADPRFGLDAAVAGLCDRLDEAGWVDPLALAGAVDDCLAWALAYREAAQERRARRRQHLSLVH